MSLVYEIFDLNRNAEYVLTVQTEGIAKELCLVKPSFVFKPVPVAETFSEARTMIKDNYGRSDVE